MAAEDRGVVRRANPKTKPRSGDLDFSADYTVTSTDDNGGRVLYTDSDVVATLTDRIDHHGMPAPTVGHNRFYAVIAPKGIRNSNTQFAGQHQSFTHSGVTAYYAWVDNTGSFTGHNCTTKVFSHEFGGGVHES